MPNVNTAKVKIGKMACETCGNLCNVKETEKGTLSYRCDECDAAPYALAGTGQNAAWRKKITNREIIENLDKPKTESTEPKQSAPVKPKTDIWGYEI